MNEIPGLFIIGVALLCILATHSIWAPRRMRVKISALLTTLLFLPLGSNDFLALTAHKEHRIVEIFYTIDKVNIDIPLVIESVVLQRDQPVLNTVK